MTEIENRIFDVNLKRLVLMTLPTWLRRPLCTALLYAGVGPLCRILGELQQFRIATGERIRYNGQVCKLRGMLNDLLDPEERRISIEDRGGSERETPIVWQRERQRWMMTPLRADGPTEIYRTGYGGIGGYDFFVYLPIELQGYEQRVEALVNMYKPASKRYAINYK